MNILLISLSGWKRGRGWEDRKERKKKPGTPVGSSCDLNNPSGYPEDTHMF